MAAAMFYRDKKGGPGSWARAWVPAHHCRKGSHEAAALTWATTAHSRLSRLHDSRLQGAHDHDWIRKIHDSRPRLLPALHNFPRFFFDRCFPRQPGETSGGSCCLDRTLTHTELTHTDRIPNWSLGAPGGTEIQSWSSQEVQTQCQSQSTDFH